MSGFINTLGRLGYGAAITECDEKLSDLVQAVTENGAAGKMTVEISIKPLTRNTEGDVSQVDMNYKVASKLPDPPRRNTLLFITDTELTTRDPRQPEKPKLVNPYAERESKVMGGK